MSGKMGTVAAMLAAAGAILSQPAAAATCWDTTAANAAQLRDLQTMLMVGALRCRDGRNNFLGSYNRFINESRQTIERGNSLLRGHFVAAGSGENGFLAFTTALANRYGGGTAGPSDCATLSALSDDAVAAGNDMTALLRLADRAGLEPVRDNQRCGITIAAR